MYWDRWKADEIKSQSIADILVDWIWASEMHGIKIPHDLVGVIPDGIVGPKTLAAVNSRNPRELFDQIKIAGFDFIEDICRERPANNKFKRGWMNHRINDISYLAYRDWETDRKSTRLNSSHITRSRMPSSA